MAPALRQSAWLQIPSLSRSPIAGISPSFSRGFPALACSFPPLDTKRRAAAGARTSALSNNAQTRERQRIREQFKAARERCRTDPMDGVSFTDEEFLDALDKYDSKLKVGTQVNGTVFETDKMGAHVDVTTNCTAYLPVQEACIYQVKHVEEAGVFVGFQENFIIVGENQDDNGVILSLRPLQHSLAWERCRQLQAEKAVVIGKVIGGKRGGVVVSVEGLRGFVPFSHIATKSTVENLIGKELPLRFTEVNKEKSKLVLSNCKAFSFDHSKQLAPGTVISGRVDTLKPYGAIINVSGLTGLLHISQISHGHVNDLSSIFKPGDRLKAMVLSYEPEKDRLSLSTKQLESTPGDMIRNPKHVYDQAEEVAQILLQRIVEAEAIARGDFSASELEVSTHQ